MHAGGRRWNWRHLHGWQINLCSLRAEDLPNLSQSLQVTSTMFKYRSARDLLATDDAASRYQCTTFISYECNRCQNYLSTISLIEFAVSGFQPRQQMRRYVFLAIQTAKVGFLLQASFGNSNLQTYNRSIICALHAAEHVEK